MSLPLAVLSAIALLTLWCLASWILVPSLLLGGLVWYAYSHLRHESVKSGQWSLNRGILLANLLGGGLLIFICFLFGEGSLKDAHDWIILMVCVLIIAIYAEIMVRI